MTLPTIPDSFKSKSFWERPEGTTGMVMTGLIGIGVFFLAKWALPVIQTVLGLAITVLGQAITITVLCTVLAALIYVVTNNKVQTLVGYLFKSLMRKITGVFVEIDPIGIMKSYIDDSAANLDIIRNGIGKLRGQIRICESKVEENTRASSRARVTAEAAERAGKTSAVTLNRRQANRLEKSNRTYEQLLTTLRLHLRTLEKYLDVSQVVIDDLRNEIAVNEEQRKLILTSHSVMNAAKRIINGDKDSREMFDMAMEYLAADYGQKLGEIEQFISDSQGFVESLDLQNNFYEEDALVKIEAWEKKADRLLLPAPNDAPMATLPVPSTERDVYAKFLKS